MRRLMANSSSSLKSKNLVDASAESQASDPGSQDEYPKGHCEIIFKNDTGLRKMAKDTVGLWHHDVLSD